MGFGSYDESEQEKQELDTDESAEGVNVRENQHHGEISFETDESAADLVERLQEMKGDDEEDEAA